MRPAHTATSDKLPYRTRATGGWDRKGRGSVAGLSSAVSSASGERAFEEDTGPGVL